MKYYSWKIYLCSKNTYCKCKNKRCKKIKVKWKG